jgi:molecular chaperone DnaK
MERIIGIDLGTTNSCVAIVLDGSPVVIPNRAGYKLTPSVFAVAENGKRLVGHVAKRQAITNARNTVFAAKRLIGRKWGAEPTKKILQACPYKLAPGPNDDVLVELRDRTYTVPEISATILQEMRVIAEEYLQESISKAVVTVPAYFNDNQRQATRDAGRIAGLDVVRIINEPTAASLAYGAGREVERKVAIFDLGGGTFDISILEISHGVFQVLATAGDTFLGGDDFDTRVIEWLVFGFAREHRIDLRRDPMALQRLKDAAERAKCELSEARETEIYLPFLAASPAGEPLHLQERITRQKLEELTSDLVDRTLRIVAETLEAATIDIGEIDDVILVGGQTRMPLVQEAVRRFFKREPSKAVHPDEVVAVGAAIQGNMMLAPETETLLLDVTPHNLGIMVVGGLTQVIIPKNTTIPTARGQLFTTARDNQTSVKIMVVQGEHRQARENELLGEFALSGLRQAPRGDVEIEVTFEIDADGIVSVSAKDLETGLNQSITITARGGLTEDEVTRMTQENQEFLLETKASEEFLKRKDETERLLEEVRRLFPTVRERLSTSDLGQAALQRAEAVLQMAESAITDRDVEKITTVVESLSRTASMFRFVVERKR